MPPPPGRTAGPPVITPLGICRSVFRPKVITWPPPFVIFARESVPNARPRAGRRYSAEYVTPTKLECIFSGAIKRDEVSVKTVEPEQIASIRAESGQTESGWVVQTKSSASDRSETSPGIDFSAANPVTSPKDTVVKVVGEVL